MSSTITSADRADWNSTHPLDAEALAVFADKGRGAPGVGAVMREVNGNGVKVRRVLQLTRDLTGKPADQLRILDLGCGDGVYTIEAATKGINTLGVDGRLVRMENGIKAAQRLGIANAHFEQEDVRKLNKSKNGEFDVIWNLGILYHLDVPDLFTWLENLYDMCREGGIMIIDTHICQRVTDFAEHRGKKYEGMRTREHEDHETEEQRRNKTFRSLDNTFNFLFSRDALVRLLNDLGFTCVMEVHAPLEVGKRTDRVTLVATKGTPVRLSVYPWVNDKTEDQIGQALKSDKPAVEAKPKRRRGLKGIVKSGFRTLGFEIKRAR